MAGGEMSRYGETQPREVRGRQAGAGRVSPTGMLAGQWHVLEGTRGSIHLLLKEMWGTHGHFQPPVPTRTFFFAAVLGTPAGPWATPTLTPTLNPTPWISNTTMDSPPPTNTTIAG